MFCLSQGHESDIIIMCLVRSNRKRQIGFLKERNRLVVGTSRQKRGLYIIGNAEFLKQASPIVWKVYHGISSRSHANVLVAWQQQSFSISQPFIERLEKMGTTVGDAIPIKFEGKQYNCHSPEELQRAASNPGSLR